MAATKKSARPDQATELGVDAHSAPRLTEAFNKADVDVDGFIPFKVDIVKGIVSNGVGEEVSDNDVKAAMDATPCANSDKLTFAEVCKVFLSVKQTAPKTASKKAGALQQVTGAVGVHTYADDERVAFAEHLNNVLGSEEWLKERDYVPINPESPSDFFDSLRDGIVLSKMINVIQQETIDERSLNVPKPNKSLNPWETKENLNLVINSAKAIGCRIVNIHAADFMKTVEEHKEYLVLGVVWQMVKLQLLADINLRERPELAKLLNEDEELTDFMKLPAEEVLLRWINYHMQQSGYDKKVRNFSSDLKNGKVYSHLLDSILNKNGALRDELIAKEDLNERSQGIIQEARNLGAETFIQPRDIVSGNKRLNLAFCAQIFNENPGLVEDESELEKLKNEFEAAGLLDDDESDSREERTFRMWMNSLNLGNGIYINNLIDELDDGTLLLDTMEKLKPGLVEPKKVNRPKEGKRFHKLNAVANCNYAVDLGKQLGFSLPGTGGVDIHNRNRKLVLGFVWQLMRLQVLETLKKAGEGKMPKEDDIVRKANERVAASGKDTKITSFKDKSISNGLFLLDLLASIEPRAINPDLVTSGQTDDEKKNNGRYVLSVARKIGATVFLTWEDIVDVKPKMILTLVASIMAEAQEYDKQKEN